MIDSLRSEMSKGEKPTQKQNTLYSNKSRPNYVSLILKEKQKQVNVISEKEKKLKDDLYHIVS